MRPAKASRHTAGSIMPKWYPWPKSPIYSYESMSSSLTSNEIIQALFFIFSRLWNLDTDGQTSRNTYRNTGPQDQWSGTANDAAPFMWSCALYFPCGMRLQFALSRLKEGVNTVKGMNLPKAQAKQHKSRCRGPKHERNHKHKYNLELDQRAFPYLSHWRWFSV
jgi:hypothetical protein